MNFFCKEYERNSYIIYINDKELSDLKSEINFSCGYIEYYVNINARRMEIKWIQVNEKHRGKGYAKKLISNAINNHKINIVELDDCSDRFMKPDNLYIKMGFRYIEEEMPEMILYISD